MKTPILCPHCGAEITVNPASLLAATTSEKKKASGRKNMEKARAARAEKRKYAAEYKEWEEAVREVVVEKRKKG